jgi:protein-S-isoprenylcysteine O-methyltransferase Ste14
LKPRIPPPVLALLAALAMRWLAVSLPVATLVRGDLRWLGALVGLLAVWMMLTAFGQFRRARTTANPLKPETASALVTSGVFAYSRNPMYLGLTLILGGWAFWLGALTPWLMLPLFTTAITMLQILPEERALAGLFGTDFAAYRRNTDRWFGRFAGSR